MRLGKRSVTAMALAATLMTGSAFAGPDPAASLEPSSETPLSLRPTPNALRFEPARSSVGGAAWKVAALGILLAGGVWVWKQRRNKPRPESYAQLHVLRRTTIGARSELLLLEIEGQRMLIGVTPSSMQTLYLLPDVPAEESAADAPSERRISALLEARIAPQEERREAARAAAAVTSSSEDDSALEGQATGLRTLGTRR